MNRADKSKTTKTPALPPLVETPIAPATLLVESLNNPDQPPAIDTRLELITPQMAREWLATLLYKAQRERYAPHVADLRYAIRQGHYSAQGVILCEVDGEWKLTNGQHRLEAIAEEGLAVWEVVIRKRGLTAETTADEYARTDRGKRRQVGDALRAHGVGEDYGLTRTQADRIYAAASLIAAGFGYTKPTIRNRLHLNDQDHRVALTRDWLPEAAKYYRIIAQARKGRHRHLVFAATMAVALVTLRYSPDQAEEFWTLVATTGGREPDDPIQQLLVVFGNRPVERTKPPVFARLVARCWKAYIAEEALSRVPAPRSEEPIEIAGSPYKGRHTSSLVNPQLTE